MTIINSLVWLKDEKSLYSSLKKIDKNEELNHKESSHLLACAILLLREYESDNRRTSYFEFGYFLILSYSISSDDYAPLFDFSCNYGFYPISKFILEKELISSENFNALAIEYSLQRFRHKNITETLDQQKYRKEITEDTSKDSSFIAPTSFGKSSLIVDLALKPSLKKIAIIVPTKSLLTQTYKLISKSIRNKKIIFHDEMYSGESEFVAIFTQERALRLLKDDAVSFDALIVDEAHNLFDSSQRSVLLSRLLRKNRKRSPSSRYYYFSPLISDSENLKTQEDQEIIERIIKFNIKEPQIFEYKLNGETYKYNRFIDEYSHIKNESGFIDYIIKNQKEKNFVYLRRPKKTEELARLIDASLPEAQDEELLALSNAIAKNVHNEFYCVDLVKKGVVYLHGKLPDLVKEYLEFKFRESKKIKFVVANSVILEGVNLPIDNLYILNSYSLTGKSLTNLIGRVNRLNEIFNSKNNNLNKLMPFIHFVNSEEFNGEKSDMSKKIGLLKSRFFKDEIKNPTLLSFDINQYSNTIENSSSLSRIDEAKNKLEKANGIKDREDFLIENHDIQVHRLKSSFIESGLYSSYRNPEYAIDFISNKIKGTSSDIGWKELEVIDKVHSLFIDGLEDELIDPVFSRLKNERARNYYSMFVDNIHTMNLKEHIDAIVRYFYSICKSPIGREFYIGASYGEVAKSVTEFGSEGSKLYIDLSKKTQKELVNIALVKIKMESDFVAYTLNEYVSLLNDLRLLTEEEYNIFIYGSSKKRNTEFTKLGLSGSLINRLEKDNQLENINIDDFGQITATARFKEYLGKQDDLTRFEISKYIEL